MKGTLQAEVAEFSGPWEVLLFSADGLERHDQLKKSSNFVWNQLVPGQKVLHVLSTSPAPGVVHDGRTVTLKAGMEKQLDVVLKQSTGEVVGRIVDETGVPQAFLYIHWVNLPWGREGYGFQGEERPILIQQSVSGRPYRDVGNESTTITRSGTLRVIAPEFTTVGTFCDAGGSFRLTGVPQGMIRVQVSDGKELLWDGLLLTGRDAIELSVPKTPLDMSAYKELPQFLRRLRFDSMEEELMKQIADRPIYREDVLSSLARLILHEKDAEKRVWLESLRKRVLSQ